MPCIRCGFCAAACPENLQPQQLLRDLRAGKLMLAREHGQLECDDGFIEARSIPGRHGWCEYIAEKGMKFRSPAMDLLAPTVTALFLENFLVAIEEAANEVASRSP